MFWQNWHEIFEVGCLLRQKVSLSLLKKDNLETRDIEGDICSRLCFKSVILIVKFLVIMELLKIIEYIHAATENHIHEVYAIS